MSRVLESLCVLALTLASCVGSASSDAITTVDAQGQIPRECPECSGTDILPIYYGLLAKESQQAVADGRAVAGGCDISREYPDWFCASCKHRWYDATDLERRAFWDAFDREEQMVRDQLRALQQPPK